MVRWVENGSAPESITAGAADGAEVRQDRRDDDVEWAGDYLLAARRD